jgi:hypothetical protein
LEADEFSRTVNESASDEQGVACDDFCTMHEDEGRKDVIDVLKKL